MLIPHSRANFGGKLGAFGPAAQVARQNFAVPDDAEDGFFDLLRLFHLAHVAQHHHRR